MKNYDLLDDDFVDSAVRLLEPAVQDKWRDLIRLLEGYGRVGVAFSGGIDSGLLTAAAFHALGKADMMAYTIESPVESPDDAKAASSLAGEAGFPHTIIPFNDLENPDFVANSPQRCYFCKGTRLAAIEALAEKEGYTVLLEGSNASDKGDYRPGMRAVKEAGGISPLAEVGLVKDEIRAIAKALGLSVWDRPSSPCLASRFPYGTPVTVEGLQMVAEGERYLKEKGFSNLRVRYHGALVRIEVAAEDIDRIVEMREEITRVFREIGFQYVTVDLKGFRSGSLNEVLGL